MRGKNLKVITLGAGDMGRWAARAVLLDERVEQVVIADLDGEAAEREAAALGVDLDPDSGDVETTVARLGTVARMIGATLRNTANPTMLDGGYKVNVIPGEATAAIDGRFVPGGQEEFLATIDELIGDKVTRELIHVDSAPETEFAGALVDVWEGGGDGFEAGAGVATQHVDHAEPLGRIVGGACDGALFAPKYVENKLKFFPYIKEAVAFGDRREKVCAFINIDAEAVGNWAEKRNLPYGSYADLARKPEVLELVRELAAEMETGFAWHTGSVPQQQRREWKKLPPAPGVDPVPEATALVDVRAPNESSAAAVVHAIYSLESVERGTTVSVHADAARPPMPATDRNRALFRRAQRLAWSLGLPIGEAPLAGGASDANLTSVLTATLDGLGELRAARDRWLGPARPASTRVHVAGLVHEDLLIEVDALAARRASG